MVAGDTPALLATSLMLATNENDICNPFRSTRASQRFHVPAGSAWSCLEWPGVSGRATAMGARARRTAGHRGAPGLGAPARALRRACAVAAPSAVGASWRSLALDPRLTVLISISVLVTSAPVRSPEKEGRPMAASDRSLSNAGPATPRRRRPRDHGLDWPMVRLQRNSA
jgi:hypothetical protein